jgi:hypothetical protein
MPHRQQPESVNVTSSDCFEANDFSLSYLRRNNFFLCGAKVSRLTAVSILKFHAVLFSFHGPAHGSSESLLQPIMLSSKHKQSSEICPHHDCSEVPRP